MANSQRGCSVSLLVSAALLGVLITAHGGLAQDATPSINSPAAESRVANERLTTVVQIDGVALTIPVGLTVTKIAAEPLVKWPIVSDWDAAGRLVVIESAGVSRPIDKHNEQRLHRVVRLIDDDGDGVFDRRMLAADKLPFAEGVLCIGNSMLVAAPPQIFRLVDDDGDGFCESRDVWFDGQTITGCANDLHGPYRGRDGWIYWCKGAFAEQTHDIGGGKPLVTSAAHIFRRRLAGGPIEPVMTGGMDNPVEMAILPAGERLFTSTFLQHPRDGLRDGIAHAVYGGVYGKPHHVIDGHRRTGELMPIMTQLGAAAPSGLVYLESRTIAGLLFPDDADVVAAALFNHHKVTLHAIRPNGAGLESVDTNLLLADRIDFHPTDLIEDRDGSLIVIDTGGWYDLCCPSSRIDQKAAGGGIYRVSAINADRAKDVSLTEAKIDAELESTPSALIDRLHASSATERQQIETVWALCRNGSPESLAAITRLLPDTDRPPKFLSAAAHAVGVHRWNESADALALLVSSHPSPMVRRAAAEALGRIGGAAAVETLMEALPATEDDRILEHSLLYALMELDQPQAIRRYLDSEDAVAQRTALMVIDQTDSGSIPAALLFNAARSDDQKLQSTALSILESRPEVPPTITTLEHIDGLWSDPATTSTNLPILQAVLSGWGSQAEIQSRVAKWISEAPSLAVDQQDALVELLQHFPGTYLPESWAGPVTNWLAQTDATRAAKISVWLRRCSADLPTATPLTPVLLSLAEEHRATTDTALTMLAALPARTVLNSEQLAALIVDSFVRGSSESEVARAAEAIERVRLPKGEAHRLLNAIDEIAPLRLPTALAAINSLNDDTLDEELLARLKTVRSARTLSANQVTSLYRNRSGPLRKQADELVEALHEPTADIRQKVESIMSRLTTGDPLKGYEVFRSNKAACSACHRIGYVGRSVGPDLTRIAQSRTRYDLLEAILFPSSRLEQSYQPESIITHDGRVFNGLVKHQTADYVELIIGPDRTMMLNVKDIDERSPSEVSIMPTGLAEQISIEDLSHLLALLEATK